MPRVLVVDDSPALRHYLLALLLAEGEPDVAEAGSALDALRAIAVAPPALLLLDLNLPTISGMELLAMLRGRADTAALPILIVSTEGGEADRAKALRLGASGYLTKPVDVDALRDALRAHLPPA